MAEMKSSTPEGLKAMVHLGILTASEARLASGANFSMDCPFCGADNALGVVLEEKVKLGRTVSPGMWNCFRCGESGNTASLLQKIYVLAKAVPDVDYSTLIEERFNGKVKEPLLREYGIVPALYSNQWWVPIFNEANIVCNIYRYDMRLKAEGSPYAFIGCPGCSSGLFNVQTLYTPPPGCDLSVKELAEARMGYAVRVAEGHWDTIALDQILRNAGVRSVCDVLGVPGANSWQASWFRLIDKRPLELFFDNDPQKEVNGKTIQPGWDGMQRIIKMSSASPEFKPSNIRIMEWKA